MPESLSVVRLTAGGSLVAYYQTVATLIPVFAIALFFQLGRDVENWTRATMSVPQRAVSAVVLLAALWFSFEGEMDALTILLHGHTSSASPPLGTSLGMAIPGAVIAGVAYWRVLGRTVWREKGAAEKTPKQPGPA